MRKWDRGVDYVYMYNKLVRLIRNESSVKRRAYYSILLIQLRNGARISEAVRCYKEFCRTGKRTVYVLVSKKKTPEEREMLIPDQLDTSICVKSLLRTDDKKLVDRLKHFARNRLGVNTHSLRYAFITYLLEHNISPSIIAKITKHSKLDFILEYTQEKKASEILRVMI